MAHQSDLINTDIHAYLAQHEQKALLRLLTCGSVDDGKSTLIGRLLHDSKLIYEDQLATIASDSVKSGTTGDDIDLALLVDGLQAEREQGITIDVAYRYFSTANRKFIIADTPGHEQYTRNMATGASTCDLAIILIDARHGVQTQTKRHSIIATMLGIKQLVIAINKMDLVDYKEEIFKKIETDYLNFAKKLHNTTLHFIPISALKGDNVVAQSGQMAWYTKSSLMQVLETIEIATDQNFVDLRFPVQYVNRPNLDFRGYCGTLAGGIVKKGDVITVLPSGKSSQIQSIVTDKGELEQAFPPMAVTLTLTDEIDVSRGDMITHSDNQVLLSEQFTANIVWMAEQALTIKKQYTFKLATKMITGSVSNIQYRVDVNTLQQSATDKLNLNEIGHCDIMLHKPVAFDPYSLCKGTGSFIIIDRLSNNTVGAGMITGTVHETKIRQVSQAERIARYSQKAYTFWLTGNNNLQIAYELERHLFDRGYICTILNEQNLTNIIAMSTIINQAGLICLSCIDSPPKEDQQGNMVTFDCAVDTMDTILDNIKNTVRPT